MSHELIKYLCEHRSDVISPRRAHRNKPVLLLSHCHRDVQGPVGKNLTGLPGHTASMEVNPTNSDITKPKRTCFWPPHCLMKIDRAQNEEISINRQTVTFWFGSGGTAPGKVISELRLTTARWEGSLWLQ